ncbi:MAG: HAD family phosphatase [Acidobacteria bacterium]|nr:HAD family phosphatase [Acidobacteriota bacterium]
MTSDLRAIIFDFNGVIIDDEPLHLELFRSILSEEGLSLSDEDYRDKYLGYDDRACFSTVLADAGRKIEAYDDQYIDRLVARKANRYEHEIGERYLLFPGVVEKVRHLSSRYPLAIVSGALRKEIELVLKLGKIREHFRVIIAAEDTSACKPDPEGYLKALAALNLIAPERELIKPDECLVIEDSVAGVAAAKSAGMHCLAVTNSYRDEELKAADWIVPSLIDCFPPPPLRF